MDNLEEVGSRMTYLWGRALSGYVALRKRSVGEVDQILVETIENFHADRKKNRPACILDIMASLYLVADKPNFYTFDQLIRCESQ